jgi:hypothetical protein
MAQGEGPEFKPQYCKKKKKKKKKVRKSPNSKPTKSFIRHSFLHKTCSIQEEMIIVHRKDTQPIMLVTGWQDF